MAEPWLLVAPGGLAQPGPIELDSDEGRHLVRVLRGRIGDSVVLADGAGVTAEAEIVAITRDRVTVDAGPPVEHSLPAGRSVDVGLAIVNGSAMDWAVQKAVEVGARRFQPWCAARSQGSGKGQERRLDHWRRVARQAIKQCHRPHAMEVLEPVDLEGLVVRPCASPVLADAAGGELRQMSLPLGDLLLVVGPEGGLTNQERRRLEAAGWPTVRLGRHVLRAETAVAVGVALLLT